MLRATGGKSFRLAFGRDRRGEWLTFFITRDLLGGAKTNAKAPRDA